MAVTYLMNAFQDPASVHCNPDALCYTAAIVGQFFGVASMIWVFFIACQVYLVLNRHMSAGDLKVCMVIVCEALHVTDPFFRFLCPFR